MNNVNKTLYIPLYGKAYVSKKGIILKDTRAEEIWQKEGFELKGKSKSKWLSYYMGMRSAVFDKWIKEKLKEYPDSVIIQLGCGMDSRIERVDNDSVFWYDVDFPDVIKERRKYYAETEGYKMISSDIRNLVWLKNVPKGKTALIIAEGVSMYTKPDSFKEVLDSLAEHFESVHILTDCYSKLAAKASKYKNPVNDVGVTELYGIDSPEEFAGDKVKFAKEHEITPEYLINELTGFEKAIFKKLYAGNFAKNLYRLYEYSKK